MSDQERNKYDYDPCPDCGHKLMSVSGIGYFTPNECPYSEDKSLEEEELDNDFEFDDRINAHYCEKCGQIKHIFVEY